MYISAFLQHLNEIYIQYIVLFQVALGKIQTEIESEVEEVKLKKGYNSLLIVASEVPDPTMSVTLPTGKINAK